MLTRDICYAVSDLRRYPLVDGLGMQERVCGVVLLHVNYVLVGRSNTSPMNVWCSEPYSRDANQLE